MQRPMPGERYKPASANAPTPASAPGSPPLGGGPKVYGVYFHCINQYIQARPMRGGERYLATCPTCGKSVRIRVGDGGTSQRMFEASC